MRTGSIIGLLFAAAIFATAPISPQVTSRGIAINVDTAQAITYGHARRVNRRMDRRDFRQTRRVRFRGWPDGLRQIDAAECRGRSAAAVLR